MTEQEIQDQINEINEKQREHIAKVRQLEVKKDKLNHTLPTKPKKKKRTTIASE